MDKKVFAETYKSAVETLGLRAEIDNDNDVVFKHPDLGTMFFGLDEKDPEYMMLVFPNFADKDSLGLTQEQMLRAVNAANAGCKAVKLAIRPATLDDECEVVATVEAFVAAPDTAPTLAFVGDTLKRNISALRAGVAQLVKEAKAISNGASGRSEAM